MFRWQNQVRVDAFLQQVFTSLSTVSWLQFKLSVQTVFGGLGNMHPPMWEANLFKKFKKRSPLKNSQGHKASRFLPRDPSGLHLIRHCDVRGPNVKLPPLLAENSPQHGAGVDAHTHVHLCLGLLAHVPEATGPPHMNHIYPLFVFFYMRYSGCFCEASSPLISSFRACLVFCAQISTHEMASTIARPIMMEQAAWSSLKSGRPQMQ